MVTGEWSVKCFDKKYSLRNDHMNKDLFCSARFQRVWVKRTGTQLSSDLRHSLSFIHGFHPWTQGNVMVKPSETRHPHGEEFALGHERSAEGPLKKENALVVEEESRLSQEEARILV